MNNEYYRIWNKAKLNINTSKDDVKWVPVEIRMDGRTTVVMKNGRKYKWNLLMVMKADFCRNMVIV